ncbi:hypothetical protein HPP92_004124 [Vanilla planifolia]|uniref:FAF domain-containing protein n=1 Tax=Vanilla planifolia TaxID=51239 RepID=A0A835VJL5_VANPL|nr:hypothetical protein HPP92_004124 [Vanilla planifolia]
MEEKLVAERKDEEERLDLWTSILKEKQKSGVSPPCPYINPAVGCKSILMSQRSLEVCTESLGSETGSDGFSSGDELDCWLSSKGEKDEEEDGGEEISGENEKAEFTTVGMQGRKELSTVNYHCSIGSRSPMRSFPPPLSSISLRGGPCIKMRPRRSNGRLVVEAVPVPSHNYLHAERHDGRLLLSFIDASCASKVPPYIAFVEKQQMVAEDNEDEEEEVIHETEEVEDTEAVEEEEVQVVDRGTIVEVKVSTQPQSLCGATAVKVHRSSLVINKFVVGLRRRPQTSPCPSANRTKSMSPCPSANRSDVQKDYVGNNNSGCRCSSPCGLLHHHADVELGRFPS